MPADLELHADQEDPTAEADQGVDDEPQDDLVDEQPDELSDELPGGLRGAIYDLEAWAAGVPVGKRLLITAGCWLLALAFPLHQYSATAFVLAVATVFLVSRNWITEWWVLLLLLVTNAAGFALFAPWGAPIGVALGIACGLLCFYAPARRPDDFRQDDQQDDQQDDTWSGSATALPDGPAALPDSVSATADTVVLQDRHSAGIDQRGAGGRSAASGGDRQGVAPTPGSPGKGAGPSVALLRHSRQPSGSEVAQEVAERRQTLEDTLRLLQLGATVTGVVHGPAATRFAIRLKPGMKVNTFMGYAKDFQYALGTEDVRLQVPIPGQQAIGLEIPNRQRRVVRLGDVVGKVPDSAAPLTYGWGLDLAADPVLGNLTVDVHVLIAGTSGAGKSVTFHQLLCSLLLRNGPDRLRLLLIDPAKVEFAKYEGIPHLVQPVITDPKVAGEALRLAVVEELPARLDLLLSAGVATITEYNALAAKAGRELMPYMVIAVDEAGAFTAAIEDAAQKLGAQARKVGIHLVIGTQTPRVDVISGIIQANMQTKAALKTADIKESVVILDAKGAEKLTGQGDMLLRTHDGLTRRVQAAYTSDEEIGAIVAACKRLGRSMAGWWLAGRTPSQRLAGVGVGADYDAARTLYQFRVHVLNRANRLAPEGPIAGDPFTFDTRDNASGFYGRHLADGRIAVLKEAAISILEDGLGLDADTTIRSWVNNGLVDRGEDRNLLKNVKFGQQRGTKRAVVLAVDTEFADGDDPY